MPYKDLEKRNEHTRQWYSLHKEEKREYRQNHKECYKEYGRKYRQEHKEQRKEYNQKYYQTRPEYREKERERGRKYSKKRREKIKIELFEFLGNKCSNPNCLIPNGCRDVRALQIDHVHGYGLTHRKETRTKSDTFYFRILREVKAGSKDYQLLCANCNWIKKFENKEIRRFEKVSESV